MWLEYGGGRGPGNVWAWRRARLRYLPPCRPGQEFTLDCKCNGKAFRDFKQTAVFYIPSRPHYWK